MQFLNPLLPEGRAWLLGIVSTLLGALGQLLFRRFGLQQPVLSWPWDDEFALPEDFAFLVAGVCCYLVAVLLWIGVLRVIPLSRAYPLLSLSYPLVALGAVFWLGESMPDVRIAGTVLVSVGVLLAVAPASEGS